MKAIRIITLAVFQLVVFQSAFSQITEIGLASFYADKFDGRITASGDIFDQNKMTAAHRTLPFGTTVKVTRTDNNESVIVTVNDRGPFVDDRIIDLSKAAATKLNFSNSGTCKVKIEVISIGSSSSFETTSSDKPKHQTKQSLETSVNKENNSEQSNSDNIYYTIDTEILNNKGFGIQVASFQEAANLMQRCYEIKQKTDKKVIVQVGESNGNQVYRIIIGPFNDKDDAQKHKEKIASKFNGCFVVAIK